MKSEVLKSSVSDIPVDVLPIPIKRTLPGHFGPTEVVHTERGNEIWLITLSDLLMLLMIFFVVLFSMAMRNQNLTKADFKPQPQSYMLTETEKAADPMADIPPPAVSEPRDMSADLEKDLVSALNSGDNRQDISIRRTADRVILTFPEKIVFDPGQARLKSSSSEVLNRVALFINDHGNLIAEVQGYTDDTPISSAQYPSNWELSVDRATQVAHSLISRGVDPKKISVKGFGEYQPLVSNRSAEERQLNRRVEIQFSIPSSNIRTGY